MATMTATRGAKKQLSQTAGETLATALKKLRLVTGEVMALAGDLRIALRTLPAADRELIASMAEDVCTTADVLARHRDALGGLMPIRAARS